MAIGWFGEDAVDWLGDRVEDAGDAFSSVIAVVPLGPELGGALKDLINGPLRDFAQNPYGMAVLRALTTSIYGPLAWTLGPQLASLTWALPGLARGESFLEAWFAEFKYRVEKTAEIMGPGVPDVPGMKDVIEKARELVPEGIGRELLDRGLKEIADRLGVDEWTAQMAIAFALERIDLMPVREDFDDLTGRKLNVVERARRHGAFAFDRTRTSVEGRAATAAALNDARGSVASASPYLFAAGGRTFDPPPIVVAASEPASPAPASSAGKVAVVGVLGAAAAAAVWFLVGER